MLSIKEAVLQLLRSPEFCQSLRSVGTLPELQRFVIRMHDKEVLGYTLSNDEIRKIGDVLTNIDAAGRLRCGYSSDSLIVSVERAFPKPPKPFFSVHIDDFLDDLHDNNDNDVNAIYGNAFEGRRTGRFCSAEHADSLQSLPKHFSDHKEPSILTSAFTTKHFVDGTDIDKMTDEDIYAAISRREQQIKSLSNIENKPASLVKKIDSVKADIAAILAYVDKVDAKSDPVDA